MKEWKSLTALLLSLLLVLTACGQQAPTWQEQYDLGVRYLSEGNYEEAIIAFTAAIEIDPKQAPAYTGRGDTYAAMASQTQEYSETSLLLEKAIADYEQAVNLGDTQVNERLQESRSILQQLRIEQEAQTKLEDLYMRFEQDDIEGAKSLMRQDEYMELSASLVEEVCYTDGESNIGLAVYSNNYYYYGQFENGMRSGHGLWIRAVFEEIENTESYIYEGLWANDLPNGEGTIILSRDPDKIQIEPGHSVAIQTETSGTFVDGLYHGTIYEVWTMNRGGVQEWTPITAVDGIYQIIGYEDNTAIVARDQNQEFTILTDSGNIHAVQGTVEYQEGVAA